MSAIPNAIYPVTNTRMIGGRRSARSGKTQRGSKARIRLRTAEEKVERVRHWTQAIDRAVLKYKGGVSPLSRWLDVDLLHALAALEKMTTALEAYVAVAPAAVSDPDASPASRKAPVGEAAEQSEDEPKTEVSDGTSDEIPDEPSPESAESAPEPSDNASATLDTKKPNEEPRS